MQIVTEQVQALLFDLDGVLVDSRAAVDVVWQAWGAELGIPHALVAATIPGKRTRDAVRALAPHLDVEAQTARIIADEQRLAHTVVAIPGAAELLAGLPPGRWAIATSGTADVARQRLRHAGIPVPDVFITAEMVTNGKPDPEAYLRAAAALGFDPAQCAVFEDAPNGIAAATRAGCFTVGVLTWALAGQLATPIAVHDLRSVKVAAFPTHLALRIEPVA